MINVGIFWAVPNKYEGGWDFYEVKKTYNETDANSLGFIDYPYSHYEKWDDVRSASQTGDCYYYPRGRILFDTNKNKHRIFVDECLDEYDLQELIEMFEITDFELCRDEHYVSAFTKKKQPKNAPTLLYNILRGQDKIGENLIEISYGETKILVELGKALDGGEELGDTEKAVLQTKYNAVIVSHYHADHAGLIEYKKDCPVYIGSGAYRIVSAMCDYHGKQISNNITTYKNGKAFMVGGIKITPFLCDHSAFDSYMLLFEAGGKSILYTGDFRFHGRKDKDILLSHLPQKVNTFICEGTNIGSNKPCISESELEDTLVEIMKSTHKPIFVLQSGSNIDRLVSVYRAAKRSNRILYEDNYVALIASAAGGKIPRPDIFPDVYAFTPRLLCGERKDMFFEFEHRRGLRHIPKHTNFVMLIRPSMLDYIKKLSNRMDLSSATLVYSMWSGYKERADMKELLEWMHRFGLEIKDLHTSGHGCLEDIELLKQTVCADEYITVHTAKEECDPYVIRKDQLTPSFVPPDGYTNTQYLRELTFDGIVKRYGEVSDAVRERAEYELEMIEKLRFEDCFLIVWDVVNYAESQDIPVGLGRGSSVGSIVAYALGITQIDPLKYSLIFERFINPECVQTPDFDIDVCSNRRGEVLDYVTRKYGANNVSRIATFGKITAKAAVKDAGRAYGYPYDEIENMPSRIGTHVAGVIICRDPIADSVPLARTDGGVVTQYDAASDEELGFFKIDFLSLTALTDIKKATDSIKERHGVDIDFEKIGYDDPKVYEMISSGDTETVFMFESDGMKRLLRQLQPSCMEDIIAAIALYRPGLLDVISEFIRNKKNPDKIVYLHPSLEPILRVSYGIIIYQEQIMEILHKLGGYSMGGADVFRRNIRKKNFAQLEAEREIFINGSKKRKTLGAVAKGIPADVANGIYDMLMRFAGYGFNKSHAAAYAHIAYQTAYLKCYYPDEYFNAILFNRKNRPQELSRYMSYMKEMGIRGSEETTGYVVGTDKKRTPVIDETM